MNQDLEPQWKRLQGILVDYENKLLLSNDDDSDDSACYSAVESDLKDACEQLQALVENNDKSLSVNNKNDLTLRKRLLLLQRAQQIIAKHSNTSGSSSSSSSQSEEGASSSSSSGENMEISSTSSSDKGEEPAESSSTRAPQHTTNSVPSNSKTTTNSVQSNSKTADDSVPTLAATQDTEKLSAKQRALAAARAKLQRVKLQKKLAAKKRDLARLKEESSSRSSASTETNKLLVKNISSSGSPEMVYFLSTNELLNNSEFLEPVGVAAVAKTIKPAKRALANPLAPSAEANIALLERQIELQQKILDAKEKMERLEKEGGKSGPLASTTTTTTTPKAPFNRESLIKRKAEAERNRAMKHYKHLVTKQQILLERNIADMKKSNASIQKVETQSIALRMKLPKLKRKVEASEAKKHALDELLAEKLTELIDLRKRVRDRRQMEM